MRNNQNKHGPDVDVGYRYAWRMMPVAITGQPPPWKATKDRCGPEDWPPGSSIYQKRRWRRPRSTIVGRRPGESPPGDVDELIMNNIDSIARSKLPDQGRLHNGFLKAYEGLMGGVCAEVNTKESERRGERETERPGD